MVWTNRICQGQRLKVEFTWHVLVLELSAQNWICLSVSDCLALYKSPSFPQICSYHTRTFTLYLYIINWAQNYIKTTTTDSDVDKHWYIFQFQTTWISASKNIFKSFYKKSGEKHKKISRTGVRENSLHDRLLLQDFLLLRSHTCSTTWKSNNKWSTPNKDMMLNTSHLKKKINFAKVDIKFGTNCIKENVKIYFAHLM